LTISRLPLTSSADSERSKILFVKPEFNRAETKSNRVKVKSNRAETDHFCAIIFFLRAII